MSATGKKEEKKEGDDVFIVERGMQGYSNSACTTEWLRG